MKAKNQRLYSNDPEQLNRWAEEIAFIGGRDYSVSYETGELTIYALPQRKRRGKKRREHHDRNKRAESAERRA